jgi:hypothetical protein
MQGILCSGTTFFTLEAVFLMERKERVQVLGSLHNATFGWLNVED